MTYSLIIAKSEIKSMKKFPQRNRNAIMGAISNLRNDPRPVGSKKLRENLFRIREGRYRIVYSIFESTIEVVVVRIAKRNERTYQNLQELVNKAESLQNEVREDQPAYGKEMEVSRIT